MIEIEGSLYEIYIMLVVSFSVTVDVSIIKPRECSIVEFFATSFKQFYSSYKCNSEQFVF